MNEALLYKVLKPLARLFTFIYIHPKYIGKENIPKEGRIILAGIHTSVLDPFILICSTKRQIHFLAKDELWKGPKKIFFSHLGLIPVNRRTKDPYSLKKAEDYLKNDKVIGIFPEGTTEKGRGLLQFKIGAVKMAYDTNTKIVPFIIKGSYNPFKKIKIVYGKPIKVSSNLERENNKLRETIKQMIKEA